jgi:hypothetical protein
MHPMAGQALERAWALKGARRAPAEAQPLSAWASTVAEKIGGGGGEGDWSDGVSGIGVDMGVMVSGDRLGEVDGGGVDGGGDKGDGVS